MTSAAVSRRTVGRLDAAMSMSADYYLPAAPVGELEVLRLDAKLQSHLERKCPELFQ